MASESTLKHNCKPESFPKDFVESQGASTKEPEKLPWYVPELKDLKPDARALFEGYSKIPSDKVVSHIKASRDKAFKTYPYPCLGRWGFLELSITESNHYQEVLLRVKSGDVFLDIGCCVGQDLRKLIFDGAPSENTYGSDLEQSFMDIGYELFQDKGTLETTFIAADVLDPESDLKQLSGKIDIIHAASFLHLFDWNDSVKACKQLATILKSKPGSMVLGRQIGNVESGELARRMDSARSRYRHTAESFEKMWDQIGEETGTQWKVEARLEDEDLGEKVHGFMKDIIPEGSRWLRFTVWRL